MYPEVPYQVTYDGIAPWGTGYTSSVPYVSVEVQEIYAGGKLGTIRTVTLNGTIASGGTATINTIKSGFASNFKTFNAPNIYMPKAMVQEVSFGAQNYIGKVDYTVTLRDFSGFLYGVNEPVDTVEFVYEQDGGVTVTHKISAVGIATDLSPATVFANAQSFVRSRTGLAYVTQIAPSFISTGNSGNIFVLSQQETINRALGSYGITETFKYDPLNNTVSGIFKRFNVDINSGNTDDYVQVSVNGTYNVGKDAWDSGLFSGVVSTELFAIANNLHNGLNPLPFSFNVEADSVSQVEGGLRTPRTATVRAVYDNSQTASFFDYQIEVNRNYRLGINEVSLRGTIVGSGRHVRRRYDSALTYYTSTMNGWNGVKEYIYNLAANEAGGLGYNDFTYNPSPKSFSVIHNSGLGFITINASFDDGPYVPGFYEFGWSVTTDCGLNVFRPFASANKNGSYLIQDLSIINRTNVSLTANFAYPITGNFNPIEATQILATLKSMEGTDNAFLEAESYNINSGEAIQTGFLVTYTKDGKNLDYLPTDGRIFAGITL